MQIYAYVIRLSSIFVGVSMSLCAISNPGTLCVCVYVHAYVRVCVCVTSRNCLMQANPIN